MSKENKKISAFFDSDTSVLGAVDSVSFGQRPPIPAQHGVATHDGIFVAVQLGPAENNRQLGIKAQQCLVFVENSRVSEKHTLSYFTYYQVLLQMKWRGGVISAVYIEYSVALTFSISFEPCVVMLHKHSHEISCLCPWSVNRWKEGVVA